MLVLASKDDLLIYKAVSNRRGISQMANSVVIAKTNKAVEGIELSAKAVKALATFNKAKEAEAKAKALKSKAEAILREALGEAKAGIVEGVVAVRVVSSRNTSFDRELMLANYPEAYEATLKTTEYDYLKTL
jgi:hypothetical protein